MAKFLKKEPLEKLLDSEDPESYARICWFIANRSTERYRIEDVIKLDFPDIAGIKGKFRLTGESIENIGRCLGLRTWEDASKVLIKVKQVEPRGECKSGHREAALQYMLYGITPTEPCPECGVIPKFGDSSMSLNLLSDEPVKGIDGDTYQTCPKCGDDMLELKGSNPVGWGWNIVCSNCGWQIKQAEELDVQQYSELMEEIKLKVDAILRLMEMPGIINRTRVESVCLQLRMVLELIIFSSLVSNKDAWKKSQDELRKAWNIKKIMKDLRVIHSKYYPEPRQLKEDYLTEDRLVTVYDQLNRIIHAENPLGVGINLSNYMESVSKWLKWILGLLTEHKVYLYHHPNALYWIRLFGGPEESVLCTPIRIDPKGKEICSWPDCVKETNRRHCEYIGDSWKECQLQASEPAQTEEKKFAKTHNL